MALLKSGITDWDEGFALLRERFGVDSDRYEELFDEAGAALEHAFDLYEAGFCKQPGTGAVCDRTQYRGIQRSFPAGL